MRFQRIVTTMAIGALALGVAACGNDTGTPGNTSKESTSASKPNKDDAGLQVKTSELDNTTDPCMYVEPLVANEIKFDDAEDVDYVKRIVMVKDMSRDKENPIRHCVSLDHRDDPSKKALVVSTLLDKEGDDTGYNNVSDVFGEQKEADVASVGAKKGFFVLKDGKLIGVVYKTPLHMVVAVVFSKPVSDSAGEEGLLRLVELAMDYESTFFGLSKND